MKITLPEHIGEITLGQYQQYYKLLMRTDLSEVNFNRRKIAIFTELNRKDVAKIKQKDYNYILDQIDKALNLTPKFQQRFKIGDVEFGMIPNFDNMLNDAYSNTFLYPILEEKNGEVIEKWDNMHLLMAILCRPVTNEDKFGNYKIAEYNNTAEYGEFMKQMPMVYVNGVLGFFYNLAKELKMTIQKYTIQALVKERKRQTISVSGDGLRQSQN